MKKVAIICDHPNHIQTRLGISPNNAEILIITSERTDKMFGYKDLPYYAMRPLYASELDYAEAHGWKEVDALTLKDLVQK